MTRGASAELEGSGPVLLLSHHSFTGHLEAVRRTLLLVAWPGSPAGRGEQPPSAAGALGEGGQCCLCLV